MDTFRSVHRVRPILARLRWNSLVTVVSPGHFKGGGFTSGAVAFVVCIVLFGAISAAAPSVDDPGQTNESETGQSVGAATGTPVAPESTPVADGGSEISRSSSTPSPTASPTPTETPTPTPEPTPTATSTPEPAPDGESYSFSGSGNDVTDSFSTEGGLVVFDFEHDGSSNFQVQAVNPDGEKEFLINEIGGYDGQVALYLPSDSWRLEVTADGGWNAAVTQPRFNQQDIKSLPAEADGEHAAWFGPFEFQGSTEVEFVIEDDSQAAVWLATSQGERVDLLHNEVGPYEGTALVTDSGIGLIVVDTSSADWRIKIGG